MTYINQFRYCCTSEVNDGKSQIINFQRTWTYNSMPCFLQKTKLVAESNKYFEKWTHSFFL